MTVRDRYLLCGAGSPTHPGEMLYSEYIEPRGITMEMAASSLCVTRQALSKLVHGHSSMSKEMALAVSNAFGRTAEEWLAFQVAWDLWQIRQRGERLTLSQPSGLLLPDSSVNTTKGKYACQPRLRPMQSRFPGRLRKTTSSWPSLPRGRSGGAFHDQQI